MPTRRPHLELAGFLARWWPKPIWGLYACYPNIGQNKRVLLKLGADRDKLFRYRARISEYDPANHYMVLRGSDWVVGVMKV